MRHRKFTFKLGRTSAHRRAMMANAVCSLIREERIKTTIARAKQIRRLAEKMVTLGKRGTLHARRRAIAVLGQPRTVALLFSEVAPRFHDRDGGYTRITKLYPRRGDAAEMCLLEFVSEPVSAAAEQTDGGTEDTAAVLPEDSDSAAPAADQAGQSDEGKAAD
jgi:large subunit ribosomal protein L17